MASFLAFDPFVTFNFLLLRPEDFKQRMQEPRSRRERFQATKYFCFHSSLARFQPMSDSLLAFDPTITFNLLLWDRINSARGFCFLICPSFPPLLEGLQQVSA